MRRNLQIFLTLIVVLAVWAACRRESPKADEIGQWIRLEESSQGCFHADQRQVRWTRQAGKFVSKESPIVLSVAQVEAMRYLIRASSHGRSHFAEEIGLTPQALQAHQSELLRSVGLNQLPSGLAHHLDYSKVLQRAKDLAFHVTSTTRTRYKLQLEGEPRITVEFRGGCEYGFPWSVDCGREHWETCSTAMLDGLLQTSEPNCPSRWIFRSSHEWRAFWNADSNLGRSLWLDFSRDSQQYQAQQNVQRAPGYASVASVLKVDSIGSWPVASDGSGAYYRFSVAIPKDLDLFTWDDQKGHVPLPHALDIFRQACAEVRRHPWLGRWRAQAAGRQLKLCMLGNTPLEMAFYSLQPWERSGLPGRPEFQIDLLENDEEFARVYLSRASDQSLMTEREHQFCYHPSSPSVVLIDTQGKERKIRAVGGLPTAKY